MSITNKISTRKILSIICAIIIIINGFTVSTFASDEKEMTINVSSETAEIGDTVYVTVNLKGNTGLWGLKFNVSYDHSILTLTSAENGDVFDNEDVMLPSSLDKEKFVYLAYYNSLQNNISDGNLVTLKFTVSEEAQFMPYIITLDVEQAIDVDGNDVDLTSQDGTVSVVKCVHLINPAWESDADAHWHNCIFGNCSEKIENTVSPHQLVDVPGVKATCTEDGLTSGKKCSVCGYFLKKQEVVKATGHTPVVVPAVKATTEKTGLTQGKKCKTCGKILVAQKKIPRIAYKMTKSAKTSGKIKMYKKMKTSSKVIKTIKKGAKVTIVDINGTWYKIKYKGKVGFVKSKSVAWASKIKTKTGKLRLRSGAGTKYTVINSFPSGTKVTVVASTANGWYKVRIKKDNETSVGYMSSKFIT